MRVKNNLQKSYFALVLFTIVLLILLFIGVSAVYRCRLAEDFKKESRVLAQTIARSIDQLLLEPKNLLSQLALALNIDPYFWQERIETRLKIWPYFDSLQVLDRAGRVRAVVPENPDLIGSDYSQAEFFRQAIESGRAAWSSVLLSSQTGQVSITISLPFKDGIIAGIIRLDRLSEEVGELDQIFSGRLAVVDNHGVCLIHPDLEMVRQRATLTGFLLERKTRADQDLFLYRETEGRINWLVTVVRLPDTGWYLIVSRDQDAIYNVLDTGTWLFIGLSFLLLGGVWVGFYRITRRLIDSLALFTKQISEIRKGNYSAEAVTPQIGDLSKLAEIFFAMQTDLAARESDLVKAKTRYREAVEAMEDGLWEWRAGDGLYLINRSFAQVKETPALHDPGIGINQEDLLDLIHPEDRGLILFWLTDPDSRALGTSLEGEIRLKSNEGGWIPLLIRGKVHEIAPSGLPLRVLGTITDLTRTKKAEAERARLESQLLQEQKLSSVGTLANGVAHEINNPLMGMINYAQLLFDRLSPEGENLREWCQEIISEGLRISDIVRNLLAFSRQDYPAKELVNLESLITGVLSLTEKLFEKHEIKIITEFSSEALLVNCSVARIQQVVLNLLTNARDALNERFLNYDPGKYILLTTEQFLDSEGSWARISVIDNGSGIPEGANDKVFDPFFTTKPTDSGTGLGLAISYGIVKDHEGRLSFGSRQPSGTAFYLDLPL